MIGNTSEGLISRRLGAFIRGMASTTLAVVTLWSPFQIGAAQALPQAAMPVTADAILTAGRAGPTPAWIEFCKKLPRECAHDAAEPAKIALDQGLWQVIADVNERVNGMIIPVTDQDHWGVADRWDYPDDGLGDCEDIQLLKRRLLVEAG